MSKATPVSEPWRRTGSTSAWETALFQSGLVTEWTPRGRETNWVSPLASAVAKGQGMLASSSATDSGRSGAGTAPAQAASRAWSPSSPSTYRQAKGTSQASSPSTPMSRSQASCTLSIPAARAARSRSTRKRRSPITRSVTSVTTHSMPAMRLSSSYTGL